MPFVCVSTAKAEKYVREKAVESAEVNNRLAWCVTRKQSFLRLVVLMRYLLYMCECGEIRRTGSTSAACRILDLAWSGQTSSVGPATLWPVRRWLPFVW